MNELRDFFTANVAAAAALLGLLFVAVSMAPERVFGPDAEPPRRERAERAFTALSNVFFVSLAGLLPRSAAHAAGVIALLAILQVVARNVMMWRRYPELRTWRHLGILSLSIYGLELLAAHRAATHPGPAEGLAITIFVLYAYALGVSWQLMGGGGRPAAPGPGGPGKSAGAPS